MRTLRPEVCGEVFGRELTWAGNRVLRVRKQKWCEIMKIKEILPKVGRGDFYLMHLSHNNASSRKPLWDYAERYKWIGLSHSKVNADWFKIRNKIKFIKGSKWPGYFRLFCEKMEKGDCVVVMSGVDKILGIGCVDEYKFEPSHLEQKVCKYKGNWRGFFDNVRRIEWVKNYPFNEAVPVKIPGSGNWTIMYLSPEKPNWKRWKHLLNVDLGPVKKSSLRRVPALQMVPRIPKKFQKRHYRKKYGPGGESESHKKLKKWVANNPHELGLSDVKRAYRDDQNPYRLRSGDLPDIVFIRSNDKYAVVEIETTDPFPGAYQALKYKVLLCAQCGLDIKSPDVDAILVAWSLPQETKRFCRNYGIRFVKKEL